MSGWDPQAKLCGNCRFWLRDKRRMEIETYWGEPLGVADFGHASDCRRHAPIGRMIERPLDSAGPYASSHWPTTQRESWCGDFEACEQNVSRETSFTQGDARGRSSVSDEDRGAHMFGICLLIGAVLGLVSGITHWF